jgi:hypothetical protein
MRAFFHLLYSMWVWLQLGRALFADCATPHLDQANYSACLQFSLPFIKAEN